MGGNSLTSRYLGFADDSTREDAEGPVDKHEVFEHRLAVKSPGRSREQAEKGIT